MTSSTPSNNFLRICFVVCRTSTRPGWKLSCSATRWVYGAYYFASMLLSSVSNGHCSGIIILMISVHYSNLYGLSYFAIFLAAAGYSAQAPGIGAWISNNVVSPTKWVLGLSFIPTWCLICCVGELLLSASWWLGVPLEEVLSVQTSTLPRRFIYSVTVFSRVTHTLP